MRGTRRRFTLPLIALVLVTLIAASVAAQSTTATIRGKVTNEKGASIPDAEINAVSTTTGFVQTVHARSDGAYTLGGLTPGLYQIVVASSGYEPKSQDVQVLVGQNLDLDLKLTPTAVLSESITVVGNQAVETRTHEQATNVTPAQMEALPQAERNFLNFAQLSPGISISRDPQRKTINADALPAEQTNVFIDGISFKNDVLQGGVVGQDSSGGNPFPQNAVQEFRVITQNYSAQYDHASSAIITAVTKSGTNQLDGRAFVLLQPKSFVTQTTQRFEFESLSSNPDYHRTQGGINVGGPIVKDLLHYFLSYEGDNQHATQTVTVPSQFNSIFGKFNGVFPAPFKSNLGFGKLTWEPARNQFVDFSGQYRHEDEIRDFGQQIAQAAETRLNNSVYDVTARHQFNTNDTLNQLSLSWQWYRWNPIAANPTQVGLDYQGAIRIGGNSTTQDFKQRRLELRDDYNVATLKGAGDHNIQVGANVDFMKYDVTKFQNGNPVFHFRQDPANGFTFPTATDPIGVPFQVEYGFGNPKIGATNREQGIYGQDNWTVNPNLTLNLGLRWDYESNQIDTGYVTPAAIVQGLTGKVDPAYFSTGSNRHQFKGAIQPRLGFSYDLSGAGKSVIYGGAGRYYDRIFFNSTFDERYRQQFPLFNINFRPPGSDPAKFPNTVEWNPKFLDPANLNAQIATGGNPPQIFLLNSNLKPPYANQANLGFRQAIATWIGSVSYNYVRGYRGLTFVSASGLCCASLVPGFGSVILNDPEGKKTKYDGIHLSLERPFVRANGWGATVAYTHAKAQQTGNDLFSLDFPSAAAYGFHDVPGSEKEHLVLTGIVGLPWAIQFSALGNFSSGPAFNVLDFSKGFDLAAREQTHPFSRSIYPAKTFGPFSQRNIDLSLKKDFGITHGASIGLQADAFNLFNWTNLGCLQNFIPPEGNPNLGQPTCVTELGRR
ncbi:MAG TPA: TonB-dependent receptor, partial [Thermoanaerobaculia bacterium]